MTIQTVEVHRRVRVASVEDGGILRERVEDLLHDIRRGEVSLERARLPLDDAGGHDLRLSLRVARGEVDEVVEDGPQGAVLGEVVDGAASCDDDPVEVFPQAEFRARAVAYREHRATAPGAGGMHEAHGYAAPANSRGSAPRGARAAGSVAASLEAR